MTNTAPATFNISTLYSRLRELGLGELSVKQFLLPDWWCQEFEQEEGAVFEAAGYISKRTSLDFYDLIDPNKKLHFNSNRVCYKLRQGIEESRLIVCRSIAEKLCEVVAFGTTERLQNLDLIAQDVRARIMQKHKFVNLQGILEFCWEVGIAVIHAGAIPTGERGKKFDAMVGIYADRPVILLAHNHKSYAKQAFILSHELGHIACGHLDDCSSIVDVDININEREDEQEIEADQFAVELIYGKKDVCYFYHKDLTSLELCNYAISCADRDQVNPASIVLNYAWYASQRSGDTGKKVWRIAHQALNQLEHQDMSASHLINSYVQQRLNWENLSNDSQEFIERMTGIECPIH